MTPEDSLYEVWTGAREALSGTSVGADGTARRIDDPMPRPWRYRCGVCGRPFDDACYLGRHLKSAHNRDYPDGAEPADGRVCPICHTPCSDEYKLLSHYAARHRDVCPVEGVNFTSHLRCAACSGLVGVQHEIQELREIVVEGYRELLCADCANSWQRQLSLVGMTWREWMGMAPRRGKVNSRVNQIRGRLIVLLIELYEQ